MEIIERLMSYDFTNFKLRNNDPEAKYITEVMEAVSRGDKNHEELKAKIDKELGFNNAGQEGIRYQTLIKYLALGLEDMERGN